MLTLLCYFGPVVVQDMSGTHNIGGMFTSWQPGSRKRNRKGQLLQGHTSVTSLPSSKGALLKCATTSQNSVIS